MIAPKPSAETIAPEVKVTQGQEINVAIQGNSVDVIDKGYGLERTNIVSAMGKQPVAGTIG